MKSNSAQATGGLLHAVWAQESFLQPWDNDLDQDMYEPGAEKYCPRCGACHKNTEWFCSECGTAIGDYNNAMPELMVFSLGEVARNGVSGSVPVTKLVIAGYVVFGCFFYLIFAPVYIAFFLRHVRQCGKKNEQHAKLPG